MASASGSTYGATPFDELCRGCGTPNYSCNLVDLRRCDTTKARLDALDGQLQATINELELQSDRRIKYYCIGKSYVQARANKKFHPMKTDTWRFRGISSRWSATYKPMSYNGLVVLGAVTGKMLNSKIKNPVWNKQTYALALESQLISRLAFEKCDPRLVNKSLEPGNLQNNLSAGYVIYMAFKYQE